MKKVKNKKDIAVVILAAGNSTRMNSPKPLLKYDANITFLEKIVGEYIDFGCQEIICTINENIKNENKELFDKLSTNVEFVINKHIEYERFYSIKLGLKKLEESKYCFIQNADNPFVNNKILNELYKNKFDSGYTQPVFHRVGGHPIIINNYIIDYIKSLKSNEMNFRTILRTFQSKPVEVNEPKILVNINTIEDYKRWFDKDN